MSLKLTPASTERIVPPPVQTFSCAPTSNVSGKPFGTTSTWSYSHWERQYAKLVTPGWVGSLDVSACHAALLVKGKTVGSTSAAAGTLALSRRKSPCWLISFTPLPA